MKKIVSVSIGSSIRDHRATMEIFGQKFIVDRIGTDGDIKKAIEVIKELDGKVDVFGMGGIDLFLYGKNNRRYTLKAALPIAQAAIKTPIVDGSGLKNTLERKVVKFVETQCNISLKDKNILMVCAMDRFGMAETFEELGASMVYGDLMFSLGLPIPIYSLKSLHRVATVLMPIVSQIPFSMLYPTGKEQHENVVKFEKHYNNADIIAGDFLYIKKHMPENMEGKIIVTNTVTLEDIKTLKERGTKMLITSTPELEGRSFGTNVMEAVMVALAGQKPGQITPKMYDDLMIRCGFQHRVETLN